MSKQMETRKRRNINFQYVLIISAMHFYFKMSFFFAFNKMLRKLLLVV